MQVTESCVITRGIFRVIKRDEGHDPGADGGSTGTAVWRLEVALSFSGQGKQEEPGRNRRPVRNQLCSST